MPQKSLHKLPPLKNVACHIASHIASYDDDDGGGGGGDGDDDDGHGVFVDGGTRLFVFSAFTSEHGNLNLHVMRCNDSQGPHHSNSGAFDDDGGGDVDDDDSYFGAGADDDDDGDVECKK